MNKKYFKPLVQIIFILLVLVLALYLISRETGNWLFKFGQNNGSNNVKTATTTKDIMTAAEKKYLHLYFRAIYEVTARDKSGKPIKFELVGIEPEQPVSLDVMSDQDKAWLNIATSTKAQVLERDSAGHPTKYRIMKNDTDIVKQF